MEAKRRLRRVGASIMVSIPPQALDAAGLKVGESVIVRSLPGKVEIIPEEGVGPDAAEFMEAFLAEYGEAMAKLALH